MVVDGSQCAAMVDDGVVVGEAEEELNDGVMEELLPTESELRVLGWISQYLAAGPPGGVRQTLYAAFHLMTGPGQALEGARLSLFFSCGSLCSVPRVAAILLTAALREGTAGDFVFLRFLQFSASTRGYALLSPLSFLLWWLCGQGWSWGTRTRRGRG